MAAYEGKRFKPKAGGGTGSASAARHAAGSDAGGRGTGVAGSGSHFASRPAAHTTPNAARQAPAAHTTPNAAQPSPSATRSYPAATGVQPAAHSHAAAGARSSHYARSHNGYGSTPATGGSTPPRRGRKRNILSYVLIGVGVILLLVAAGIFVWAQLGYRRAAQAYEDLTQYVQIDDSKGSDTSGIPVVDWDALKQQNEDIVAWIYVPGTEISYPVLQGATNDQYLRTLPDGTANNSGSIMLDCDQTAPGMVDQQTTVYGHHMNDSSMFNIIEKTLDQETFNTISVVYYLTPEITYTLTPLFTARVPDTYVDARQANFGSEDALQEYLTDLRSYAQAEADDVDKRLPQTDQVLALVTCSGIAPADHRAVMICTIADETPAADTTDSAE